MKRYLSKIDENKIAKIKNEGTTLDKIKGHLVYGEHYVRLTQHEQELLERWNTVFNLLKIGKSTSAIHASLKRLYNVEGLATVYRDIANAKKLFGSIDSVDKNAERIIAIEWARMTFRMALAKKDIDGMNAATRNLIKASAIEHDDPETFTEEDMQQHVYYAIIKMPNESIQLDLSGTGLEKIPKRKVQGIIQSMYSDIDDVQAIEIMEDGK
jgi:hypothetical protein